MTALSAGLVGYAVAAGLARLRLAAPPKALMRVNYRGAEVPAILGGPLVIGSLTGLCSLALAGALGWDPARLGRVGFATAIVIAIMGIAGSWDDRRGDERPRGFAGHLGAARSARLTGGLVKLGAGTIAGGIVGLMLRDDLLDAIATALIVALAANLVNLFDRAPGRAGKVAIAAFAPLIALAPASWAIAAAGSAGALIGVMPLDLRERAMLGDAGANPVGAALGLGLALSMSGVALVATALVLLALNVLSEFVSFSKVIERTGWLHSLDQLGRK
ncbi:MAG: hypothetical protein QOG54_669 [Actinomycetota bacterium]|jgi:hypothetical protein|nr:hypothetical protein [Actinomycetota bacterium]